MQFTYEDIVTDAAPLLRQVLTRTAHETRMYRWLNLALAEMSMFHPWWWLKDEWEMTLNTNRRQDMPTVNVDGDYANIGSVNLQSVRINNHYLRFKSSDWLDRHYPQWASANGSQGTPDYFTFIGKKMAFYPRPSVALVAATPLYFSGWKMMYLTNPSTPDTASLAVGINANDSAPECPGHSAPSLIEGLLKWGQRRLGVSGWQDQDAIFRRNMDDMISEDKLMRGGESDQREVPEIFGLYDDVSAWGDN